MVCLEKGKTMSDRERLIEILKTPIFPHEAVDPVEAVADYLIDSGVVVQKHGRWENYPSRAYRRCSVCKVEFDKPKFNVRANHCPNCGAKMGGEA